MFNISSSKVFFKLSHNGGDGKVYRRGRIVEVLRDGTLVVQPVQSFRSQSDYYTTIDLNPTTVRHEDPAPLWEE